MPGGRAAHAEALGLEARVVRVEVGDDGGPEAAARSARFVRWRMPPPTRAPRRCSSDTRSTIRPRPCCWALPEDPERAACRGWRAESELAPGVLLLRPLLDVRRATTHAACRAEGLEPWQDPHNADRRFARVRVRETVLPVLEAELGPGVTEALARTAAQLREDSEAFEEMIDETIEDIVEHAEAGISVSVAALAANPAALRHRIIRHVVAAEFGASLTRAQTLEVARLVTDWSGQGPARPARHARARRAGGRLEFTAS